MIESASCAKSRIRRSGDSRILELNMTPVQLLPRRLRLASPFAIAHDTYHVRDTVLVRVSYGSACGFGEIPIVPYYGITRESALSQARLLARFLSHLGSLESTPSDVILQTAAEIETCKEECMEARTEVNTEEHRTRAHPFVCAGLSEALIDFAARRDGVSVTNILSIVGKRDSVSSFTIAERDPDRAQELVVRAGAPERGFPLKVKCGYPGDAEIVAAVRDASPASPLWVDCNGGWSATEAAARGRAVVAAGASLVEEPVSHDLRALGAVADATGVPVIADESVTSLPEIRRVVDEAPAVAGVVLKVAKLGGPLTFLKARRMIAAAGRSFMVGQMVESGIGTAWALALSAGASWVDLDAPALLAEDPSRGLVAIPGSVAVRCSIGIGVEIGG